MEETHFDIMSYRVFLDVVLWAIVLAVLLMYFYFLTVGPVSSVDPDQNADPVRPVIVPAPAPKQLRDPAPAMV